MRRNPKISTREAHEVPRPSQGVPDQRLRPPSALLRFEGDIRAAGQVAVHRSTGSLPGSAPDRAEHHDRPAVLAQRAGAQLGKPSARLAHCVRRINTELAPLPPGFQLLSAAGRCETELQRLLTSCHAWGHPMLVVLDPPEPRPPAPAPPWLRPDAAAEPLPRRRWRSQPGSPPPTGRSGSHGCRDPPPPTRRSRQDLRGGRPSHPAGARAATPPPSPR